MRFIAVMAAPILFFAAAAGETPGVNRILSNEGTVSLEIPASWQEADNPPEILTVIPAAGDEDAEVTAGIGIIRHDLPEGSGLAEFVDAWKSEVGGFGYALSDERAAELGGLQSAEISFTVEQGGMGSTGAGRAYLVVSGSAGYEVVVSSAASDASRWLPVLDRQAQTFRVENAPDGMIPEGMEEASQGF